MNELPNLLRALFSSSIAILVTGILIIIFSVVIPYQKTEALLAKYKTIILILLGVLFFLVPIPFLLFYPEVRFLDVILIYLKQLINASVFVVLILFIYLFISDTTDAKRNVLISLLSFILYLWTEDDTVRFQARKKSNERAVVFFASNFDSLRQIVTLSVLNMSLSVCKLRVIENGAGSVLRDDRYPEVKPEVIKDGLSDPLSFVQKDALDQLKNYQREEAYLVYTLQEYSDF